MRAPDRNWRDFLSSRRLAKVVDGVVQSGDSVTDAWEREMLEMLGDDGDDG